MSARGPAPTAVTAAPRLQFSILGPLEVWRDGAVVDLGARKQRALLALLLLNANRVVPTQRLIVELWRDTPLADFSEEPFAATAVGRLEEQRLEALEQRIEADLALGRHASLVPELEALVADHPYRERLRALLMLALYRSGRQADALRAYRTARRTLGDDLGLEPSRELRELEAAILRQDEQLSLAGSAPSAPAA